MTTPCRKWRGVPFTEPTYHKIAYALSFHGNESAGHPYSNRKDIVSPVDCNSELKRPYQRHQQHFLW